MRAITETPRQDDRIGTLNSTSHLPGRGEGWNVTLIINGQGFNQSCTYNEASIKTQENSTVFKEL
jgi:hypothetical protein